MVARSKQEVPALALSYATSNIVSQAFRWMELAPISSFADDSEQAQAAAEQYPEAINQCLEEADWSFASKFASLNVSPSLPSDDDLPYAYVRPGDFLRLIDVKPNTVQYRLDQDALRADQATSLTIRYMAKITDESKLPALFKQVVSLRLAANLALRWSSSTRAKHLANEFELAMKKAMRADRASASSQRHDGRPRQGIWADEALQ